MALFYIRAWRDIIIQATLYCTSDLSEKLFLHRDNFRRRKTVAIFSRLCRHCDNTLYSGLYVKFAKKRMTISDMFVVNARYYTNMFADMHFRGENISIHFIYFVYTITFAYPRTHFAQLYSRVLYFLYLLPFAPSPPSPPVLRRIVKSIANLAALRNNSKNPLISCIVINRHRRRRETNLPNVQFRSAASARETLSSILRRDPRPAPPFTLSPPFHIYLDLLHYGHFSVAPFPSSFPPSVFRLGLRLSFFAASEWPRGY